MTATIHQLRPIARQAPADEAPAAPARQARPQSKSALPKKAPSRWPLPCGRNSGWKKPLHGDAVRRRRRERSPADDD